MSKKTAERKKVRYCIVANPFARQNGWDVYGDGIDVSVVSSGVRVDGGELTILDVTTDDAGHAFVEEDLEAHAGVVSFAAAVRP